MKKTGLTAGLVFLFTMSYAQTKQPVLIGVDIVKPILSLATPNRPAYRLAEATVKIPLVTKYLSIAGGYGQSQSGTIYRNMQLNTQGYYLKVGIERQPLSRRGVILGWNGLITTCRETGTYSFPGPTFGDYVTSVPERRRVAVGVEGVLGHQFLLSQRLLLRLSGRMTVATLIGPQEDGFPANFVPGIGHVVSDPFAFSVGMGIHLFYQLSPRPATASSNDQNH